MLCQMVFGTNMLSLFIEHRRIYCVYSNVTWRKLRKYCAYTDLFKSWPHLCSTCYIFFLNNLIFFLNSARETIDPNFRTRESPRISVNVNIRYRWYWISTRVENREKKKKEKSYLKHSIYFLTYTLVIQIRIGKLAHQLVHSCHDVRHFFPRDATVAIDVVKRKCPAQFLIDGTTRQYAETSNEVLQHRNKIHLFDITCHTIYIYLLFSKSIHFDFVFYDHFDIFFV